MKKINEVGRSMVEMLGVLGIIGVLSAGGLAGFSKAMYKYQMNKTISMASDALQEFALFLKRDVSDYPSETANMAINARKYGLVSECEPTSSSIAGNRYGVCRAPLGEIYPRFFVSNALEGYHYTYMYYVTFLKNQHEACIDFLSKSWDRSVSARFWKKGVIWLVSNRGSRVAYTENTTTLSVSAANSICSDVCPNGVSFCSVVFDFSVLKY